MAKHFHTIVTHFEHHPDEARAIWKLKKFGRDAFPGIETAQLIEVPSGTTTYLGKDWQQLEVEGYLMVGVGKGRFDDHGKDGEAQARKGCASALVSGYLKLNNRPELEQIDNYVFQNDTAGEGMPTDLASRMKRWWREGVPAEEVLKRCAKEFDEDYDDQCQHFLPALKDFSEAKIDWAELPSGQKLRIMTIHSDSEMIGRIVRSKKRGQGTKLFIQRSSRGNVLVSQVLPKDRDGVKESPLDLRFIAGRLRLAEGRAHGVRLGFSPKLFLFGTMPERPEWFLFANEKGITISIMNGSTTNQETPATWLTDEQIVDCVIGGLADAANPERVDWLAQAA